jgi:hypothetical protein
MQPIAPFPAASATTASDIERQAKTWLVIAIVSSVACLSLCLGIGGAVFCYLAMQAAAQGLLADAQDKLKWGKVLTLVGSAIGVATTGLLLIYR